jgi:serine/threonine protein kinase
LEGDHPFRHVKFEYSIQFEEQFMKREVEPHLPSSIPEDFYELLQQMVAWDPKERPSFDDIYPELKQMYLMHKQK